MSTARVMVQITITDKEINEAAKELLKADKGIYSAIKNRINKLQKLLESVDKNLRLYSEKTSPQVKAFGQANRAVYDKINDFSATMTAESVQANEKKISATLRSLVKKDLSNVKSLFEKIGKGKEKLLVTQELENEKKAIGVVMENLRPRFERNYKELWDAIYGLYSEIAKSVDVSVAFSQRLIKIKDGAWDNFTISVEAYKDLNRKFDVMLDGSEASSEVVPT